MIGVTENISHSTAKMCHSNTMHSFWYKSQIKRFSTHVDMDIFSCFGMWNSYPKFICTFQLHTLASMCVRVRVACVCACVCILNDSNTYGQTSSRWGDNLEHKMQTNFSNSSLCQSVWDRQCWFSCMFMWWSLHNITTRKSYCVHVWFTLFQVAKWW
jgi:hypothetical protein